MIASPNDLKDELTQSVDYLNFWERQIRMNGITKIRQALGGRRSTINYGPNGEMNHNGLEWLSAELACELNSIHRKERMSINTLREALSHIPGGSSMTMRYGLAGRTQIFMIGEDEIEVGPDATASDIEAALEFKKKD